MACSSGCPTPGQHQTFGECLRSKRLQISGAEARDFNQSIYHQQDAYVAARRAGLQPETIFKKDVDQAWALTEATGVPFRADAL